MKCPVDACSREINGVTYESCQVCDDVFEHKDAFGDDFKFPVSYKCSAKYGTNQCRESSQPRAPRVLRLRGDPRGDPSAAPAPDYHLRRRKRPMRLWRGRRRVRRPDSESRTWSRRARTSPSGIRLVVCDNDSMGGDPARATASDAGSLKVVPEESQPEAAAASEPTLEPCFHHA